MRTALAFMTLLAAPEVARSAPAPLAYPVLPATFPGISVGLAPFVTIPPEAGVATAPLARIQYATPVNDISGRLFVNDLNGTVYRTSTSGVAPTPWFDLAAQLGAAAVDNGDTGHGLQSIAFHPNFNGSAAQPGYGKFYTSTNGASGAATIGGNTNPGPQVAITEWTTDPKAQSYTAKAQLRLVMQIGGCSDGHSNGLIAFNPTAAPGTSDYGKLYVTSGDGHFNDLDQNGQNPGVPQGKMLRIDPLQSGILAYTIPADNPFVGRAGSLPEIWATGLRYPQSFSWDRLTGTMYINDLGQAAIEEVNVGAAGANYGWSQREGTFSTGYAYGLSGDDQNIYPLAPGGAYTDPIAQYEHPDGAFAAVGSGFAYRGTAVPALYGMYVLEDIVSGGAFYFDPAAALPGGQAPLHSLGFTIGGAQVRLDEQFGYDNYYSHRVDARLSEDGNGEL